VFSFRAQIKLLSQTLNIKEVSTKIIKEYALNVLETLKEITRNFS